MALFFSFLHKLSFKKTVFNPLQSDALCHFYIRKTKMDASDTYLIAQVIRIDLPYETPFIEEDLLNINTEKLASILNYFSKGRLGKSRAMSKPLSIKKHFLATITGISDVTACVIFGT